MSKIGYARVSTIDQDLTLQIQALKKAGCEVIRKEKASGASTKGRTEFATVLEFLRKGDCSWSLASIDWRARLRTCRTSSEL